MPSCAGSTCRVLLGTNIGAVYEIYVEVCACAILHRPVYGGLPRAKTPHNTRCTDMTPPMPRDTVKGLPAVSTAYRAWVCSEWRWPQNAAVWHTMCRGVQRLRSLMMGLLRAPPKALQTIVACHGAGGTVKCPDQSIQNIAARKLVAGGRHTVYNICDMAQSRMGRRKRTTRGAAEQ
jgi:hypothetical protein